MFAANQREKQTLECNNQMRLVLIGRPMAGLLTIAKVAYDNELLIEKRQVQAILAAHTRTFTAGEHSFVRG